MQKAQEYYIQVLSKDGTWKTVTKSYESVQLIEMSKELAKKYRQKVYQVVDINNKVLWLEIGKGKDVLTSESVNVRVSDE